MEEISFADKVEGSLNGGKLGDTLGLPLENMRAEEIRKVFLAWYLPLTYHDSIVDYVQKNRGNAPISCNEIGYFSDDTILTLAGVYSIIEKAGINIANLFLWHKKMHTIYGGYGFSGTMDRKLTEYDGGEDLSILKGESYGNGVLMKQFPYAAYFHSIDYSDPIDYVDNKIAEIASITHDTPVAKLASIIHNKVLMHLLSCQPDELDLLLLLNSIKYICIQYEEMLGIDGSSDTHLKISTIIDNLIIQKKSIDAGKPYTYDKILETYLVKLSDNKSNNPMKAGYHVASTFGIVYSLFLQDQNFSALLDAIKIGYDTDSQAAVIGNMIGALRGKFYDEKYIAAMKHQEKMQEAIKEFIVVLNNLSGDNAI